MFCLSGRGLLVTQSKLNQHREVAQETESVAYHSVDLCSGIPTEATLELTLSQYFSYINISTFNQSMTKLQPTPIECCMNLPKVLKNAMLSHQNQKVVHIWSTLNVPIQST